MFEPTNGHYAATFSITNVSTEPLWFEGWRMNDPVYYLEWKSRAYLVPMPVNGYDDAGGLRGWRLATGQGTTFSIMLERRPDTLEPFRVGVEVWPDGDYHQVPHWICWSETVTP